MTPPIFRRSFFVSHPAYAEENISVKASKNLLCITETGDNEEGVKFVHHGISKKDVDFSLNIDEAAELVDLI